MEQSSTIKESKEGKLPKELEQELPEIAVIIKTMLSINPNDRPSLEMVIKTLKLPIEMYTELAGELFTKKENSRLWRKKHFKLIGGKLYLFNKVEDKKAECVYDLSEWKVQVKNIEGSSNEKASSKKLTENEPPSNINPHNNGTEQKDEQKSSSHESRRDDVIIIENPFQLGCAFKGESGCKTAEIYEKLNQRIQSL